MDGQQRAEYAALLEQRRAAHVRAWREGAAMAYDPASALRLAEYFESCEPHDDLCLADRKARNVISGSGNHR